MMHEVELPPAAKPEPKAAATARVSPSQEPSVSRPSAGDDEDGRRVSQSAVSDLRSLGIPGAPRTMEELEALSEAAIAELVSGLDDEHLASLLRAGRRSGWLEPPSSLAWNNVFFEGPDGSPLVDGVAGYAQHGQTVGVFGSGASQLLEVLGGRSLAEDRPNVRGEVLLNQRPPSKSYERLVSYVPREDCHQPLLTVRETVHFSSRLRFHRHAAAVRALYAELVIKQLGLAHVADSVVGGATVRGISGGERRRLSVATEMVSGAAVLVADLPTNGLDSTTALEFVRTTKAMARTGNTNVFALVAVGQDLWAELDTVLLLTSGGRPAYFGPPDGAVPFLESCGFARPDGDTQSDPDFCSAVLRRPGDFFRGGRGTPQEAADSLVAAFLKSPERAGLAAVLATDLRPLFGVAEPGASATDSHHQDKAAAAAAVPSASAVSASKCKRHRVAGRYNATLPEQARELMLRDVKTLTRDKGAFYGGFARSLVLALLMGTTFFDLGDSQADARSRISILFFALLTNVASAFQILPTVASQRQLFLHQRRSYFNPGLFSFSYFLASLPMVLGEVLVFTAVLFPLVGLQGTFFGADFWFFYTGILLAYLTARSFFYAVAIAAPNAETAQAIAPLMFMINMMVAGFLTPRGQMPAALAWLHWVSFLAWAIRALAKSQLPGLEFVCEPDEQCLWRTGDDLLAFYDMDDAGGKNTALLVLFGFFVLFQLVAAAACVLVDVDQSETGADNGAGADEAGDAAAAAAGPRTSDVAVSVTKSGAALTARAALEFRALSYDVQVPNPTPEDGRGARVQRRLLNEVSGYAVPGRMIALMGASGAGKSTLLDVLAGKKNTGVITGEVLVNGRPKDGLFHRYSAYVEQFDSHEPTATVREAVALSARLRLAGADADARLMERAVSAVLDDLELAHVADSEIGSPETGGLSPELRKKASIAVETVTNPGVLFLDEPTTGLESAAALGVMRSVRRLASRVSVVATVHQPSAEVMELFDDMLLLQPGGHVAYFGPVSGLAAYLERQGHGELPRGANIADFALEAVRPAAGEVPGGDGSAAARYAGSERRREVDEALERGVVPADASLPEYDSAYAAGRLSQTVELVRREARHLARDSKAVSTSLGGALFVSLLVSFLFWNVGADAVGHTVRLSVCFILAVNPLFSAQELIPGLVAFRLIYFRETTSHTYSAGSFYAARIAVQIPITLLTSILLVTPLFFMSNLVDGGGFGDYLAILAATWVGTLTGRAFAEVLATSMRTAEVATAALIVSVNISMLFAGFFVVEQAIPTAWKFLYHVNIARYPLFYIAGRSLDTDGVGRATLDLFGIDTDDTTFYFGLALAWLLFFRVAGYLVLRFVQRIKR